MLSDRGVPIGHVSRLVGHKSTTVTEKVYRQQIRPVMDEGATAMDSIFPQTVEGAVVRHHARCTHQNDEEAASGDRKGPLSLMSAGWAILGSNQ
ncbi:hypothetical protein [Actinomadura sp. KC216]|uniref:hypothetical protein n=1 Tax=Actinomadura sp. KC216 TaxID=2530370 RepID=UPI001A9DAB2D|nr:hypothetical protein [Actinomadura sp. KC216]